jgi:hypothetical protein
MLFSPNLLVSPFKALSGTICLTDVSLCFVDHRAQTGGESSKCPGAQASPDWSGESALDPRRVYCSSWTTVMDFGGR